MLWTDTVATECGDQRDRDRSGLTLWQKSVETNATETEEVKLKQYPALSFQEAGPEVSTQLIGKQQP